MKNNIANKKYPAWFYIFLFLIPFLFILLLEFGLTLINYSGDDSTWIQVSDDKIVLNPLLAKRYFSYETGLPHSNHEIFDKVKKGNTFRIFVLGASTTAGFPYSPNGAFSRIIRDKLDLLFPKLEFEVINLGIAATNTYTILDIIDDVIEQDPDLILIYSGQNEYYGALGIGSSQNIGSNRTFIKLYLYLNQFKVFKLLRDFTTSVFTIFSDEQEKKGTLMNRVIQDQVIPINSDSFNSGINQFKENYSEIIQKVKSANIPLIVSTLTFNLRDQFPFQSVNDDEGNNAATFFQRARDNLINKQIAVADSLFRLAKDYDALRFRAPESFNNIIKALTKKHEIILLDIDSIFSHNSKYNIPGNDIMIDHLHPTLDGYRLLGDSFLNNILLGNIISERSASRLDIKEKIDSLFNRFSGFSKLDSVIASQRIKVLLNDFPFRSERNTNILEIINPKNFIDSLAFQVSVGNSDWEKAHRTASNYFLSKKMFDEYMSEINSLLSQYPFRTNLYEEAASILIKNRLYDQAKNFLYYRYLLKEDDFNTKWLGNIYLFDKDYNAAVNYLEKSLEHRTDDPQVYFNLTVGYFHLGLKNKSIHYINKCLAIAPDYPGARQLKVDLEK